MTAESETEELLARLAVAVQRDHLLRDRVMARRWRRISGVLAAIAVAATTATGVLAAGASGTGWALSDRAGPDVDRFYSCPSKPLQLSFGHDQMSVTITGRRALSANPTGANVTSVCTRMVAPDGRSNPYRTSVMTPASLACVAPETGGRYVFELRPLRNARGRVVGTMVNAGWVMVDRGASILGVVIAARLQPHASSLSWWSACQRT